jgi:hypothetical protein
VPAIDIGPQCSDPYPCDFHGHCRQHIPEDSVFDLRERDVDPRRKLAERLLGEIPEGSSVVAWKQAFEKRVPGELVESFPGLAPRIGKLLERFRDAMILAALTRACGRAGTS